MSKMEWLTLLPTFWKSEFTTAVCFRRFQSLFLSNRKVSLTSFTKTTSVQEKKGTFFLNNLEFQKTFQKNENFKFSSMFCNSSYMRGSISRLRLLEWYTIFCKHFSPWFIVSSCWKQQRGKLNIWLLLKLTLNGCHFSNMKGECDIAAIGIETSHLQRTYQKLTSKLCKI